ncbi:MAG TPA: hypothetical protein VMF65_25565 [Acidimicrobiales bacterium]|nr:hypothetical protein [Acidimicrobiales bacterium]
MIRYPPPIVAKPRSGRARMAITAPRRLRGARIVAADGYFEQLSRRLSERL